MNHTVNDTVLMIVQKQKVIKCSFLSCEIADRKKFINSSCILPVSVGKKFHEAEKFEATLQLINRTFKHCSIMIDDTIQRYTLSLSDDSNDDVLRRNVQGDRAHIDPDHPIHDGDQENHPRPFGADDPSQAEDHAALVFVQNLHAGDGDDDRPSLQL